MGSKNSILQRTPKGINFQDIMRNILLAEKCQTPRC